MTGVCARRFCFVCAAGVSVESLPIGHFPDSIFLRSTEKRWRRDGVLPRLFDVGAKAQARMESQYVDYIHRLTLDGERVTGKATEKIAALDACAWCVTLAAVTSRCQFRQVPPTGRGTGGNADCSKPFRPINNAARFSPASRPASASAPRHAVMPITTANPSFVATK